nr:hypothetical protein [Tanacetum cinerariifolium]
MTSFNQRECLGCGQPCDGYHYSCTCQQCGVILLNGICLNCIHGDGKPITCCVCECPLRGGFCLFCDSKAKNSFTYDPNAYSFNDTSRNFNHLPQPQYETYLCELCGNDSHYGYDCQPQFSLVYEQEPSYKQNYNDHSVQYKEYLENSSNSIAALNFNQEKKGPPQDSDIRQLVREECGIEVCEEQKKKMEDTMLELLEVCRQKEFYCMYNDVDDLIESALNSKLLSINLKSKRLDKKKQEVKNIVEQPTEHRTRISESLQNFRVKKSSISLNNTSQISPVHAIAPVLPTKDPEYSLSMGYENISTPPEMESDEVNKSSIEKLVPILSECEVTSDNERECDVPVCKDSSTFNGCEDYSEILSDSNNDDISSDDDSFEDIEYVEASPLDSELVGLEEENDVYQEDEEFNLEYIFQIQDIILREKLLSINRLIADIESLNDNPTPNQVDLFLASDNSIPLGIENFNYDSEGDIHFLKELLVDGSIPFLENESSYFDYHDDPSFPRPPPKQPDVEFFFDFEPNSGKVISSMMNKIDELNEDECFDPGGVKTPFWTLASPLRAGGISLGWNFHVL